MASPRSATADPALRGELIALLSSSSQEPAPIETEQSSNLPARLEIGCILFDVYGTLFVSASGDVGTAQTGSDSRNFERALAAADLDLDDGAQDEVRGRYFAAIEHSHSESRSRGIESPEVDIADIWTGLIESLLADDLLDRGETFDEGRAPYIAATAYETLSNPVAPMPDLVKTISRLAASSIPLGIVSNAQFYTPLLFPAFLGKDHTELGFREELCSWSYLAGCAKPSVRLFAPLVERLENQGIPAASVLYVGNDMLNDVWTAGEAGLKTALFAGDRRSLRLRKEDPRCRDLRPDMVIRSLSELLIPLDFENAAQDRGYTR